MRLEVLLYGAARTAAGGRSSLSVELSQGARVAELRAALASQHPVLARLLEASRIAVDHGFATDDSPVREGAELALIPPVSGGSA